MTIYVACDYRGLEIKKELIEYLKSNEIDVQEIGLPNYEYDEYQDFAFKLGQKVVENKNSLGILVCSTGIGMSIAANKVKGIRCVRATSVDDASTGRNHNDANVLAVGANLGIELIKEIVDTFISTKGPTLERRINRINKIIKYENGEYNEL